MTTAPAPSSNDKRELLRHTVATLAYRGGKAVRNAPPEFKDLRVADGTRTPGEILAHIAMLRRIASGPIKGENYFKAEIESGRVGADQSSRRTEF